MSSALKIKALLGLAAAVAFSGVLGGCQSADTPTASGGESFTKIVGDYLNFRNSLLDPSQVGRFDKANPFGVSKPVTWPILEQLDALDEPDIHWIGATDPLPSDLVVEQKEYILGEGDFLNVSVFELVTPGVPYTAQPQVNEVGNITVQNLGQVHVTGMTPTEVEDKIGQLAVERGFLLPKGNGSPGPQVSVQLAQSRARVFSTLGQVGATGTYNIIGTDFRLLDALALSRDIAGGAQPGMDYLYVIRPQKDAGVVRQPYGPTSQPTTAPSTNPLDTLDKLKPSGAAPKPANDTPVFVRDFPKEMLTLSDKPELLAQAAQSTLDAAIGGGATSTSAPASAPTTTPTTSAATTTATTPATSPTDVMGSRPGMIFLDGKWVEINPSTNATANMSHDEAVAAATSLTGSRLIRIPINKLKEGDSRYNIVIRPGDIINVPNIEPGEFYLYGHVGRPGVYSLTGRKVTLKMAMAAAGGLDAVAIPRRCELVRRLGTTEVTMQIDLQRIFDGEQPDIFLKANDWVNVGTDLIAPFLSVTRNAYRASYGWGFVYDRNLYNQPTPTATPAR